MDGAVGLSYSDSVSVFARRYAEFGRCAAFWMGEHWCECGCGCVDLGGLSVGELLFGRFIKNDVPWQGTRVCTFAKEGFCDLLGAPLLIGVCLDSFPAFVPLGPSTCTMSFRSLTGPHSPSLLVAP